MKKFTDRPIKKAQGWGSNEAPYFAMINRLTQGKTEEEKEKVIKDFQDSHTCIFICDMGSWCPLIDTLMEFYRREQEEGTVGFIKAVIEYSPITFGIKK